LRFKQILINLLSNANKFTKKGDIQLNLSFESIDATHGNCIFSIQDEGIGMSSEQVERIFEPFEQAETSTSRKYGGTGLGLSITKRIVEKMNGSITVNSVMNQGTHFFVTIPMKKSTEEAEQAKPYTPDFSFLANKNILIVDDEPFNRLLLNGLLKSSTAHIFEAENGVKALEIIANEQIDLLLLDVQMPEMNGEEVVQHVLEHHPDAFPIVGLTATLDVEQQHLMLKRGWSDVLIKPIVPKTLEETLKKQMNQHGK
jgi:CheY-like chemotaxis protein